jgi:hypothetical protein
VYQEYFLGGKSGRCLGLTNLPPSCADCLEVWEPQTPGTSGPVQGCNGITLALHMTNNDAVSILVGIESNNKIISEYVMNSIECEKLSFLPEALTLRIAGPKDKLFQMLTPTISKSATYSKRIKS